MTGQYGTDGWPPLIAFDETELPAFPTNALPQVLGDWVRAESHATQTPADLPGMLSIAVCAASIARRVEVEPRPGWREPVNVYVAILLEPANRKSAVFADALTPLKELESELIALARLEVARKKSRRRQEEACLKAAAFDPPQDVAGVIVGRAFRGQHHVQHGLGVRNQIPCDRDRRLVRPPQASARAVFGSSPRAKPNTTAGGAFPRPMTLTPRWPN